MAKTIPQLTDATTVNAADELIIQQGGITKRATGAELAKGLNAINGTVSVKDFGAVGDGVADDLAAFQAARDSGSLQIYIPKGTYRISSQLEISVPNQQWVFEKGATIKPADSGYTSTSVVRATAAGVGIIGATIDGNLVDPSPSGTNGIVGVSLVRDCTIINTSARGVVCNDMGNFVVENNFIKVSGLRTTSYGVWAQNTPTPSTAAYGNMAIRGNVIDMTEQPVATSVAPAILVRGSSTHNHTDVRITGNRMVMPLQPTNTAALGCEMRFVTGAIFSNNYVRNGSMLVSVAGSNLVTVDGNVADNQNAYAVEVAGVSGVGCEDISITGNIINGGGICEHGIALQGTHASKRTTISGNVVKNASLYSIFANSKHNEITITGNSLFHSTASGQQYGVYFLGSPTEPIVNASLSGNIFECIDTTNASGLYVLNGSHIAITSNIFDGWPQASVLLDARNGYTSDYLSVTGNVFTSNSANEVQTVTTNVSTSFSATGDESTDVITATGHTFTSGQRVRFSALTGGAGLATATDYFVRDLSGDTFKLAASSGGAAIDFTTAITAATIFATGIFGSQIQVLGSPDFRRNGIGTTSLDLANSVQETWTTGSPESAATAGVGSTFRRTNGAKGRTLYVKESGTGNTGWFMVPTSSGTTGGSGSAGSGSQFVELNVNGTTYKVLHDGTV